MAAVGRPDLRFRQNPLNRPRQIAYRGRLWIHAGTCDTSETEFADMLARAAGAPVAWPGLVASALQRVVLGSVRVTGCHHAGNCGGRCTPWAEPGYWHWKLAGAEMLPEQVWCPDPDGADDLWPLPAGAWQRIQRLDGLTPPSVTASW